MDVHAQPHSKVSGNLGRIVHLVPGKWDGEHGHSKVDRLEETVDAAVGDEELGLWVVEDADLGHPTHQLHVWTHGVIVRERPRVAPDDALRETGEDIGKHLGPGAVESLHEGSKAHEDHPVLARSIDELLQVSWKSRRASTEYPPTKMLSGSTGAGYSIEKSELTNLWNRSKLYKHSS